MNPNGDPQQYVQQLEMQLQDAQLVIGRQQLQLLHLEQALRLYQSRETQPSEVQDQAPGSESADTPSVAKISSANG